MQIATYLEYPQLIDRFQSLYTGGRLVSYVTSKNFTVVQDPQCFEYISDSIDNESAFHTRNTLQIVKEKSGKLLVSIESKELWLNG